MILALRALGVGDLATGVPALRGLRAAFPDERFALAAPAWLTPLIDLIGGIDRIVPVDGLDTPLPPMEPPALAVNLHGRGPQSHRLLRATEPGKFWAFETEGGPSWADDEHELRRWCRLLDHYGVPASPDDLTLAAFASGAARRHDHSPGCEIPVAPLAAGPLRGHRPPPSRCGTPRRGHWFRRRTSLGRMRRGSGRATAGGLALHRPGVACGVGRLRASADQW